MTKASSSDAATRQVDALKAKIKKHLKKQGITQADLAKRLDCTPANVSKLLRAGGNTTMNSLMRLADAAGLELVPVGKGRKSKRKMSKQEKRRAPAAVEPNLSETDTAHLEDEVLKAVQEVLGGSKEELREYLGRIGKTLPPRQRGRKRVPFSEYQPHVEFMADLIVGDEISGVEPNEREASRQAAEWALKAGFNVYSSETIRTRFRAKSDVYLKSARERRRILDRNRRQAKKGGRSRSSAPSARYSGVSHAGSTSSRVSDSARTSSLIDQHLATMVDRFGLSERAIELLSRPNVFEEACRVAEAQAAVLEPIKAQSEVLKSVSIQKDLFDQISAQQIAEQSPEYMGRQTAIGSVPHLPDDLGQGTALGSVPRFPENRAAKPVGQDIIDRQLAMTRPLRTMATDSQDLIEKSMRASKPIETGIAKSLGTSVNDRMEKIFDSFKVKSGPFD